jgi:putative ABC transport system permease protein
MFRNYIKVAIRNLQRNKMFSFINIFGLAISMSVCLLVLLRIKDQFSYDKFHPHPQRTYRIVTEITSKEGEQFAFATTPLPLAPALNRDYNIIEKSVRLYPHAERATAVEKKLQVGAAFTEPSFFNVFGFKLKSGNHQTALAAPKSVVLSEEAATRFFGVLEPMGQVLSFEKLGDFIVTGVLETPPGKSHVDFEAYLSISSVGQLEKSGALTSTIEQWNNGTLHTLI